MTYTDATVGLILGLLIIGPGFMAWYMDDSSWLYGYIFTLIIGLAG